MLVLLIEGVDTTSAGFIVICGVVAVAVPFTESVAVIVNAQFEDAPDGEYVKDNTFPGAVNPGQPVVYAHE